MPTRTIRSARLLKFVRLSANEKSLFREYLSEDRISASLRKRMKEEIKRQSDEFIELKLPRDDRRSCRRREDWRLRIRGPIGGWEQKGRRIRRKWDPARRPARLSFELIAEPHHRWRTRLVYDGDLFEWWILRLLATGEIRNFFACRYCGDTAWRQRSSAYFCSDRHRMLYHLAMRNRERLKALPPGRRMVEYRTMKERGAAIGLIDIFEVRRRSQEVRRQLARRWTR